MPSSPRLAARASPPGRSMPPSMTKCAMWMFFGASSRARLCARPRSANLPIAKGADSAYPLTLADDDGKLATGLHYGGTPLMDKFTYVAMPMRVVFGAGAVAQLGAEVERLGAKRVLLISTPGRASMVREVAHGLQIAGIFDQAV